MKKAKDWFKPGEIIFCKRLRNAYDFNIRKYVNKPWIVGFFYGKYNEKSMLISYGDPCMVISHGINTELCNVELKVLYKNQIGGINLESKILTDIEEMDWFVSEKRWLSKVYQKQYKRFVDNKYIIDRTLYC